MKKGFLFGLGVLIAGGVLAATISTISIDTKTPGDTVTNQEFNSITSGLGEVTDTFNGTISTATSITIPKDIQAEKVSTPELCLGSPAECQTSWPVGEAGGVTAKDCPEGQQLQSVTAAGVFTCGTDQTTTGGGDNLGNHIATQAIVPSVNNSFDLGSTANKFAKIYAQSICINGDCQTEWPTGGAGITDQACGTGQVVKGITGGTFDCVLDANDGGASSPIGTLLSGKWCWSPDGITLNCDQEAPDFSTGCVDYQYSKCVSNKIWWFDSCDMNMAIVKEDCTSLGGCTAGEIGGTCVDSASGGGITITPQTCPAGQHLYKANSDGTFVCSDDSGGGTTITPQTCPAGQHLYKANSDGTFVCSPDIGSEGTTVDAVTCGGTDKISAFNATTGKFTCSTDQTGGGGDNLGNHIATQTIKNGGGGSKDTNIGEIGTPFSKVYATNVYGNQYCNLTGDCIAVSEVQKSWPINPLWASIACTATDAGRTRIKTTGTLTEYQVCMKLIPNGGGTATYQWATLINSNDINPPTGTSIIQQAQQAATQ